MKGLDEQRDGVGNATTSNTTNQKISKINSREEKEIAIIYQDRASPNKFLGNGNSFSTTLNINALISSTKRYSVTYWI